MCDVLTLTPRPSGIRIVSRSKDIPKGFGNLVYQAARLLQDTCGVRKGVKIRIRKNIPVGAGLGGGSSNAASTLLGLNKLWDLGLSKKALLKLGAQIGSDVPFFILETRAALGRGRGEILKKVSLSKKIWHVIVNPGFKISTKEAYGALESSQLTPRKSSVKMLLRSIEKGDREGLSEHFVNTLELTLNKRVTKILDVKKKLLSKGAVGALLSGSGACVFGIFRSRSKAERAARWVRAHTRWRAWAVSTF